jgi:hypothetical protein
LERIFVGKFILKRNFKGKQQETKLKKKILMALAIC